MATDPGPEPERSATSEAIEKHGSFGKILKGTALVGSVQLANAVFSILRMKFAALLLGPAGIGIIGLLSSFQSLVESVARMGLGTAGVREIVQAEEYQRTQVRLSLRIYAVMLALLCFGCGAFFPNLAASLLTDGQISATTITWLFAGASFGILGSAGLVELRGLHKIGKVALAQLIGAGIGTAISIASLFFLPNAALLIYVVVPPLAILISTAVIVFWEPFDRSETRADIGLLRQWRSFLATGFPVMLAGFSVTLAMYLIRVMVNDVSGAITLGYFVAAFMLSSKYLDFLFKAMSTDFYPRIAAVSKNAEAAAVVIERQTRVLLNLGTPILILMIGFAPLILNVMYSKEFSIAARVFQICMAADFLKMVFWPIDFYLLAQGRNIFFTLKQFGVATIFTLGVLIFYDGNLDTVGWAYFASRIFNAIIVYSFVLRLFTYRVSRRTIAFAIAFISYFVAILVLYKDFTMIIQGVSALIATIAIYLSASDIRAIVSRKRSTKP